MSKVVGIPKNSYKPITNTAWVHVRLCKWQKWCTRLAAASDQVYQLLAHGRWFSPGTPASSISKAGLHDIAEILLKVASTTNQNQINILCCFCLSYWTSTLAAKIDQLCFCSQNTTLCDSNISWLDYLLHYQV